jgi:aryl-alcohol dehydrogenase-like predicted oxidoreductase
LSDSKRIRSQTDVYFNEFYGDDLDREIRAKVESMALEHDTTLAQVALAWVCSKKDICCPIIGASSTTQLEDNVNALQLELRQDEIATLDALYRPRDVINDHVTNPMPRLLERT